MVTMQGKNLAKVKQENMESLKTILYRYAPLARAEIADQLSLTPPTITNIVAELIQQGVVRELPETRKEDTFHGVGRKPVNIDLIPDARFALGVSLGRDSTHYCITDLRGNIYAQERGPLMPEDYDTMVHLLIEKLKQIKQHHQAQWERLIGIGIVMPGIIDAHHGIIKNTGNERLSWKGKPLAETIRANLELPVRIDNNARGRASAMSLFHPDVLGDTSTFAFCLVSWGIACPIVLDNRSLRGANGAGEIGKMIIIPDIPALGSEVPGSLESLSSVSAILARCRLAMQSNPNTLLHRFCPPDTKLTLEHVLQAQKERDVVVCSIMEKSMWYLGIALANIVDFLNPGLILLSGKMFDLEENFTSVEHSLFTHVFRADDERLQLIKIHMDEYSGAVGAAANCIEEFFLRGI